MTEPSVEEIVARLEREIYLRGQATLLAGQFRTLIASWRERGEKIEILEAEIRVMRKLPSAIDAALGDKP